MHISEYEIPISKRELEVLKLLSEGYTSKQIGYLLRITEYTVITYRERLKEKYKCKNCLELIYKATKLGTI
jgi:DNA-binding CsgD family transcriptional regulator